MTLELSKNNNSLDDFCRQYQEQRNDARFIVSPAMRCYGRNATTWRIVITGLTVGSHSNTRNKPVFPKERRLMQVLDCSSSTVSNALKSLLDSGLYLEIRPKPKRLLQQTLFPHGDVKPLKVPAYPFQSGLFAMLGGKLQKVWARMVLQDSVAAPNAIRTDFSSWANICEEFTRRCRTDDFRKLNQGGLRFIPADNMGSYAKPVRRELEELGLLMDTREFLSGDVEPGGVLILNPLTPPPGYEVFMRERYIPRAMRFEQERREQRDKRARRLGLYSAKEPLYG